MRSLRLIARSCWSSGEVDAHGNVETATAGACGVSPVSAEQATAAFSDYLAQNRLEGGTNVFIDAECSFIYRNCKVTLPESDYINFGPIILDSNGRELLDTIP